jgi:hypothetical protein
VSDLTSSESTTTGPGTIPRWLVAIWILFGGGWLIATTMRPPGGSLFYREILNVGHGPLYAVFAFLFTETLFRSRFDFERKRSLVLAFVVSMIVGVLQESIQFFMPRDADLLDVLNNMLGTFAGLGLWSVWREQPGGSRLRHRVAAVMMAVLLMVVVITPAIMLGFGQRARDLALPLVFDPGSGWTEAYKLDHLSTLDLVSAPAGAGFDGTTDPVYRWNLKRNVWPRAGMHEVSPDWRSYERLVTEWYLAGTEDTELGFRVNDRIHNNRAEDRYEVRRWLRPGYQRLEFALEEMRLAPDTRELDLGAVAAVFFYLPERTPTKESAEPLPELWLGRWTLE